MKNLHWSDLPDNAILFVNSYNAGTEVIKEPITAGEVKEFIPVTEWHKIGVEDLKELFNIEIV